MLLQGCGLFSAHSLEHTDGDIATASLIHVKLDANPVQFCVLSSFIATARTPLSLRCSWALRAESEGKLRPGIRAVEVSRIGWHEGVMNRSVKLSESSYFQQIMNEMRSDGDDGAQRLSCGVFYAYAASLQPARSASFAILLFVR
jgi:hypothetical protein